MELAGRKALLTGATGGLGRAIAEAMAAPGRDPPAQRPQARGARGAGRGPARATATASCPPTSPSPVPPSSSPRRRGTSTSSSPTPGCRAPGWLDGLHRRGGDAGPAGQPRGADADGPGAVPGDGRARLAATWSSSPRSRARRRAPAPRSTTRPSSACAASPSVCASDLGPKGVGVSLVSPGLHPRGGDVRRRRAPSRRRGWEPARPSRSARAVVQGDRARQGRGRGGAAAAAGRWPTSAWRAPAIVGARPERRRPARRPPRAVADGPPAGQAVETDDAVRRS